MKVGHMMKYLIYLTLIPLFFTSCGGSKNEVSTPVTPVVVTPVVTIVGVPAGAKVFTTFKDDTINKRFVAMKNAREEYYYTTYGSTAGSSASYTEYDFGFLHLTFSASVNYSPFVDSDYFTVEATKTDTTAIEAKRVQLNAIFANAAYWQTLKVNNNLTRAIAIIDKNGNRYIIDLNFPILANPVVGYSPYSNYYIQNGLNYAVNYTTYYIDENKFIKL